MTSIDELPIDFYPLESDVLSMEMDNIFKVKFNFRFQDIMSLTCCTFTQDLYVENETSSLYQIARGLMTIQSLFGTFPNVIGKGRYARQVFELMSRMRRDIGVDSDPPITPQFDTLLILDRTVDLTTPVVTQLTYEGLIDEFYGIKHSE